MRVFGCARKIYFPEIIWSWPGKWAFDHGNGLKLKFSLQTISGSDAQRERERERESARARGSQITPSTSPAKPRSSFLGPTIARYSPTIERKPRSYDRTLHTPTHHDLHSTRERECASEIAPAAFTPRTQSSDFAGDPETSRHEPRASTSPETQRLRATNPELRLRIAPIDFAGEPRGQDRRSTSTSPAPIALSLRLRNSWVLMNLTEFD